jgi:autophagy-related protein 2
MMRIQIRTPSPPPHVRRSGALVFDLHDIVLSTGSITGKKPMARFARADMPSSSPLGSAECRRIVIGCSPGGDGKATAIISLGPLSVPEVWEEIHAIPGFHEGTFSQRLKPHIALTKSNHATQVQSSSPTLGLTVDIPSIHAQMSKVLFDDLQYWIDDATQLVERIIGDAEAEKMDSRDTSLIGSRYFARSRWSDSGSGSRLSGTQARSNDVIIKVAISEGCWSSSEYCTLLTYQSPCSIHPINASSRTRKRSRHHPTILSSRLGCGCFRRTETRRKSEWSKIHQSSSSSTHE